MSAILDQIASFISWLYSSVSQVVDFVNSSVSWLHSEWLIIQTVSNTVFPPALQFVMAAVISFLFVMLIVKAVFALL